MSNSLMQSARQLAPSPPARERSPIEQIVRDHLEEPGKDRLRAIALHARPDGFDVRNCRLVEPPRSPYLNCDLILEGEEMSGELRATWWYEAENRRLERELKERLKQAKEWVPTLPPGEALDFVKHLMGPRERLAEEAKQWRQDQRIGEPPAFSWDEALGKWVTIDGQPFSGRAVSIPLHLALDPESVDAICRRRYLGGSVIVTLDELDDDTAQYLDDEGAHRVVLGPEFHRLLDRAMRKTPPALTI